MIIQSKRYHYKWKDADGAADLLDIIFAGIDRRSLAVEQVTGGTTNLLYQARFQHASIAMTVLIRVYGKNTQILIDRSHEVQTAKLLSERDLAGTIYGIFDNGYVHEYVHGRALQPAELKDYNALIAREFSRWHRIAGDGEASVITTLRKWLNILLTDFPQMAAFLDIGAVGQFVDDLASSLRNKPLVLCHNDLLAQNIIITPDRQAVRFIDFEYAAFNVPAYDLANHFCEYAGFECDWRRIPGMRDRREFVLKYLLFTNGAVEDVCLEDQVQVLMHEINLLMPASHLMWGLWGLLQSCFSDIHFDYQRFALDRLSRVTGVLSANCPPYSTDHVH